MYRITFIYSTGSRFIDFGRGELQQFKEAKALILAGLERNAKSVTLTIPEVNKDVSVNLERMLFIEYEGEEVEHESKS